MRCPERVETSRLEHFDLAIFRAVDRHGAKDAVVVVNTAATQLIWLAVDAQAILGVDLDPADAEGSRHPIDDFAARLQRAFHLIEMGRVRRPQPGTCHFQRRCHTVTGRHGLFGDGFSCIVEDAGRHHAAGLRSLDPGHDLHGGLFLRHAGCGDRNAPLFETERARDVEPHMPVNARARIPAAVAADIGRAHRQHIVA